MSQQSTIFMALEQQIKQQQEQHFSCAYCNQQRTKTGFFHIFEDIGIKIFCSQRCADNLKKKLRQQICQYCGIIIESKKSSKKKYCSQKCAINIRPKWYKYHNWCDLCNKWIPKKDSIIKEKGFTNKYGYYMMKRDHYFCPKCHNELRTTKKYNKNNNKNGVMESTRT